MDMEAGKEDASSFGRSLGPAVSQSTPSTWQPSATAVKSGLHDGSASGDTSLGPAVSRSTPSVWQLDICSEKSMGEQESTLNEVSLDSAVRSTPSKHPGIGVIESTHEEGPVVVDALGPAVLRSTPSTWQLGVAAENTDEGSALSESLGPAVLQSTQSMWQQLRAPALKSHEKNLTLKESLGPAVLRPSRSASMPRQCRVVANSDGSFGPAVSGRSRSVPMPPSGLLAVVNACEESLGPAVAGPSVSDLAPRRGHAEHGLGPALMGPTPSTWKSFVRANVMESRSMCEADFGPPVTRPNASTWRPPQSPQHSWKLPLSPQHSEASSLSFGPAVSGPIQSTLSDSLGVSVMGRLSAGNGIFEADVSRLAPSTWKVSWSRPAPSLEHEIDCFGLAVSGPSPSAWLQEQVSPRSSHSCQAEGSEGTAEPPRLVERRFPGIGSPAEATVEIWC